MSKQLTAITDINNLKELRQLYAMNWPKNCVGYYWLDTHIRWLSEEPNLKHLNFYTLNDNWRRDGLFILIHRYQIFFCTLNADSAESLFEALKLLNWANGFKISSVVAWCRAPLLRVLQEQHVNYEPDKKTTMYYMTCAEAQKLTVNCPTGYYLKPLSTCDADIIDRLWSARHHGSLQLIRMLITKNPNVSVYVSGTNELAAWCLRLQGGFLGALEVREAHKRRGLGLLAASAISKRIALDLNHDIMALVNLSNDAASALFLKLGFQVTDTEISWFKSLPSEHGVLWPENE